MAQISIVEEEMQVAIGLLCRDAVYRVGRVSRHRQLDARQWRGGAPESQLPSILLGRKTSFFEENWRTTHQIASKNFRRNALIWRRFKGTWKNWFVILFKSFFGRNISWKRLYMPVAFTNLTFVQSSLVVLLVGFWTNLFRVRATAATAYYLASRQP